MAEWWYSVPIQISIMPASNVPHSAYCMTFFSHTEINTKLIYVHARKRTNWNEITKIDCFYCMHSAQQRWILEITFLLRLQANFFQKQFWYRILNEGQFCTLMRYQTRSPERSTACILRWNFISYQYQNWKKGKSLALYKYIYVMHYRKRISSGLCANSSFGFDSCDLVRK